MVRVASTEGISYTTSIALAGMTSFTVTLLTLRSGLFHAANFFWRFAPKSLSVGARQKLGVTE